METYRDPLHMNSRRTFTKTLMASLAAVPVLSSLISCKGSSPTEGISATVATSPSPESLEEQLPSLRRCTQSVVTVPHEPPIGFSDGGSLIINVPESNRISFSNGSNPRPHNHTLGTANYTSIHEVGVLTRPVEGPPFFILYRLPPNPTYQMRLWLVQLINPPVPPENTYEIPGTEPQLILKATAPHIETEARLVVMGNGFSHKRSVPLRYDYPPAARHFHIGKWQITDANGRLVQDATTGQLFQGQGDDSYEIYVSFNHPRL